MNMIQHEPKKSTFLINSITAIKSNTIMSSAHATSRNSNKDMCCAFCKGAGKPESVWSSHWVREERGGKPCCPTLAATVCKYCKNEGKDPETGELQGPHTWKFCLRRKSKDVRRLKREKRQPQQQRQPQQVGRHFRTFDAFAAAAQKQMAMGNQQQVPDLSEGFVCVGGGGAPRCASHTKPTIEISNPFATFGAGSPKTPKSSQTSKVVESAVPRQPIGVWGNAKALHATIAANVEKTETSEAIAAVDKHIKQDAAEASENVAAVQQSIKKLDIAKDFGGDDVDSDDEGEWGVSTGY